MGRAERAERPPELGPDKAGVLVYHTTDEARRLVEALREGAYTVVTRSQPEGLGAAARGSADVIVLDVGPEEAELQLCRELREESGARTIPVILAVSPVRDGVLDRARRADPSEVIIKPVDPYELLLRVSMVLRRAHLLRQAAALEDKLQCYRTEGTC